MQYLKIYFLFPSAVFRCLSNDIALKGLFLHHCVVFSLFCVAIVISDWLTCFAFLKAQERRIRRSATAKLITRKLVRFNLLWWTQKTNTVKALEIQTMIDREARRIKTTMETVSPDISTYKLPDLLENILYIAQ